MSELIDREALLDECLNHYEVGNIEQNCTMDWICKTVRNFPTASPWHRVEEELPKEDGKYLVYMFTSAWRWEFKFAGYLHGRWIGAGGGDVRYWMPIEPPKEDA